MYYLLLQLFSTTTTNTSLLDVDQMFSCFADKLAVMDVHVLEDLHNIIRGSYTPRPVVLHLPKVACWSSWMIGWIPKRVEGTSRPRVFLFEKDDDGVVRHWYLQIRHAYQKTFIYRYRQQLQSMKKKSVAVAVAVVGAVAVAGDGDAEKRDEYMPANGRGYSMFPNGIPDFGTLFATPFKPMDVQVFRKMMTEMTHRFSGESVTWWTSLLDNIESEDAAACTVCQGYRVQIMKNASHCHDGDDLRKEKNRAYSKVTKELARHMVTSGDGAHSRFVPRSGGELLPPGRFLQNSDAEEEEQVFLIFLFVTLITLII